MHKPVQQPIDRSDLRLKVGAGYHTCKRYLRWCFGGIQFARRCEDKLPYEYVSHQTPLLRQLKGVEMHLQYNKIENLKIALPKVNGVIIYPGETFSYWKLIGRPTKRKGYLEGMVLKKGTFKAGIGGGLCQLSNLIYWLALHTPLTVVERHRHAYDVFPDANRTQPFGSGATCFFNYGDLMIQNNTQQSFQLVLEMTGQELRGAWKSQLPPDCRYEVYEKAHQIQQEPWGGYTRHNLLYRKKYDLNQVLLADEYITENHAIMMYAPLLSDTGQKGKEV